MASETTTMPAMQIRRRRRVSTSYTSHRLHCHTLPYTLEALDLSATSPIPSLATLRVHVLSYLADLEARLALFDAPALQEPVALVEVKSRGELTLDEARAWARDGLAMLHRIRRECESFLPALHMEDLSVESMRAHLPDMPDMRAHLPDMPDVRAHLPDMPDVRAYFPDAPTLEFDLEDVRTRLSAARDRFSDLDFHQPLSYLPTLSDHLDSLQTHLGRVHLPSHSEMVSFAPSQMLSDLLDKLLSSDLVGNLTVEAKDEDNVLERAAKDLARAMKESMHGAKLIAYHDLPQAWRNNRFVTSGYRFIPLEKWPLIILSLFALHNETLNIHTHLIPFCLWLVDSIPFLNASASSYDLAERAFISFALICLFASAMWHTMAGCAHPQGMDFCARVDYVGIGWLISASVGTVVYYGFQGHDDIRNVFLSLCLLMGMAGSVLPFMKWFNNRKYRWYRIAFFVTMAFVAIAPLGTLAYLYSTRRMLTFIAPVLPSLYSYAAGLVFYATHFPECVLSGRRGARWLDWLGGGSHAIWHAFIVLAISQHKWAMAELKRGVA